jgi:hypothetical protein
MVKSPARLLLPANDHLVEADVVHLGDDKPDTRDISHGTAETAADALDLDFIVFIDKVDCPVANCECADLTPVLDELDAHTLADGRVGLLCLNTDLFEYDTSRLRSALEGLRIYPVPLNSLILVVFVVIDNPHWDMY